MQRAAGARRRGLAASCVFVDNPPGLCFPPAAPSMVILKIWLAASFVLGACWAIVGLLLGEPTEADRTSLEAGAEDEAA